MKKIFALLLLSVLFAVTVIAEDITTIDGTVYKNIKITEITPIGVNFVCEERACWVDFRDLPPDVANKYGYDPVKAAEFEKSLAQNQGGNVVDNATEGAPDGTIYDGSDAPAAPQPAMPGPGGVTATLPAPDVIENLPPPSQAPQVIVINNGDTVIYDDSYQPTTVVWVSWCGRYYPRYYWNYWYWNNRYIRWNGRYYPAHCFYRGGVWDHGKYYHYAPDRRHNFPERDRSPRQVYSAPAKREQRPVQSAGSDNRKPVKNQPLSNEYRGLRDQPVKNDNRAVKVQATAVDNSGTGKVQPTVEDNRGNVRRTQNNDNRNPGWRPSGKTDGRFISPAAPVAHTDQGSAGKAQGAGSAQVQTVIPAAANTQVQPVVTRPVPAIVPANRTPQVQPVITRPIQAGVTDTRGTAKGQVPATDGRASSSTVVSGSGNATDIQGSNSNDRDRGSGNDRDRRGGR
ncbi:MAG: hypothetical protein ACYC4Q_02860 [Victivallaceae bacterium]